MRVRALFVLLLLVPILSSANIFQVNPEGSGEYPNIQAAIDACAFGDTVLCAAGEYTGEGNYELSFGDIDLVLCSEMGSTQTVVRSGRYFIEFGANQTQASVLEGFTLFNFGGYDEYRAAITCDGGSPTLRDLVLTENSSGYWQGCSNTGGAMSVTDGSPFLEDVVFQGNRILLGNCWGVGGALGFQGICAPFLRRVRFEGNIADGYGGGLYCSAGTFPTFEEVSFVGNQAVRGGGLYLDDVTCLLSDLMFRENRAGRGGAIYLESGTMSLEGSTLAWNSAEEGAGIYLEDPTGGGLERVVCAFNGDANTPEIEWDGNGEPPLFLCCDVYSRFGPAYSENIEDPTGTWGNISEDPLFCGILNGPPYLLSVAANSPCLPENNDCGVLMGAEGQGCGPTGVEPEIVTGARLAQNYPNPFNPKTNIPYSLDESGPVELTIFDITGRKLRVLVNGIQPPGDHETTWDGRDDEDHTLSSGVYIYHLNVAGQTLSQEMLLLK